LNWLCFGGRLLPTVYWPSLPESRGISALPQSSTKFWGPKQRIEGRTLICDFLRRRFARGKRRGYAGWRVWESKKQSRNGGDP
jgi:hypothetical protein